RQVNANRPAVMAPSSAHHRMTTLITKPTTPPTTAGTQSLHASALVPRPETAEPGAPSTTAGRRRVPWLNQGRRATEAGRTAPAPHYTQHDDVDHEAADAPPHRRHPIAPRVGVSSPAGDGRAGSSLHHGWKTAGPVVEPGQACNRGWAERPRDQAARVANTD